ncbi:MAG: transposase, partial [Granulosicoccaceae bacterium]
MPTPRKALIAVEDTPYYHVVSRCVRRAFLCGVDTSTGKNYEYRRAELEERLLFLGTVFAIDICAYAIMSNHHHEVLHIDQNRAMKWSDEEVVRRWHQIYDGTLYSQRFSAREPLSDAEKLRLDESITEWRKRLASISWFMRRLNEPTARQANKEDGCTGKFFEARFKSQALLDEQALIACMAYNDLNPIRAKLADTPEDSDHTSIKLRIEAIQNNSAQLQAGGKRLYNTRLSG